jgi:hypothetical protein
MSSECASAAVAGLRAAVDSLLDLDLAGLRSDELTSLMSEIEVEKRRLVAVDHHLLSEVGERGVAGEYGRTGTADLLIGLLRVAPGEARARVVQAQAVVSQRTLTGERLDPVLPRVAQAVQAGAISAAHAGVIAQAIEAIPHDIVAEAAPVAEAMLVEAAAHEHPRALQRTAALLLARLDPDGHAPRDADIERRRGFTITSAAHGASGVRGAWTAELTAVWQAIFDALASPQPAADGMLDERSPRQRRHDALLEAGLRLLRSGTLPAVGGVPVTVVLRTSTADLRDGGTAMTGHGDLWPVQRLRGLLGETAVVPVVIDHDGAVLACGRSRRLASPAQRYALTARDGGCCFPGCGRPAAWCQVHHVREWVEGGPTDIDNLCLLCAFHHREFAARGWTVVMINGLPHWTPPAFVDPVRRAIRNHAHHPPDLDFATPYDARAG